MKTVEIPVKSAFSHINPYQNQHFPSILPFFTSTKNPSVACLRGLSPNRLRASLTNARSSESTRPWTMGMTNGMIINGYLSSNGMIQVIMDIVIIMIIDDNSGYNFGLIL